ncbi:MAG: D-aminoacylase, partial [Candidatus Latescibacteria bacterium]|nr:D-aminoacylase [Candidatus Latescibacterota bacterium]
MTDLLIRGGRILDGSGTPAVEADLAVTDGRITAIGDLSDVQATEIIGARGRMVCPGFIDIHTHSDLT